jgi:integrase/recombinase XerD
MVVGRIGGEIGALLCAGTSAPSGDCCAGLRYSRIGESGGRVAKLTLRDCRDWVEEVGLKGKSAHGLRKSAAQRLALDSHSTNEIAAIGGWETLSEVQRHTKGANRRVLAEQVKRKRDKKG